MCHFMWYEFAYSVSKKSATQCHRRLAAEYIAEQFPDIEIVYL